MRLVLLRTSQRIIQRRDHSIDLGWRDLQLFQSRQHRFILLSHSVLHHDEPIALRARFRQDEIALKVLGDHDE